jgi:predicted phosphodiesterase
MIYLTGDTHSDVTRFSSHKFREGKDLTKNDYVIILGDFGLLWSHTADRSELYWYNWLKEKPWTTLFLDGNHENFDRIDNLDQIEKFGSTVGVVNDSIFHLKRGEVYEIDGINFFVFGGGKSIDKHLRIPGISWWDRELPNYAEYSKGFLNLDNVENEVDYVLTHDAPTSIYDEMDKKYHLLKLADFDLPKFLERVKENTRFIHWYFGHFHFNDTFKEKFTCLYEKVIRLGS